MSDEASVVKRRRALEIHTDTYREKWVNVSEHEKAEARDDSEGNRRRCCGRDLSHMFGLSLLVGSIR